LRSYWIPASCSSLYTSMMRQRPSLRRSTKSPIQDLNSVHSSAKSKAPHPLPYRRARLIGKPHARLSRPIRPAIISVLFTLRSFSEEWMDQRLNSGPFSQPLRKIPRSPPRMRQQKGPQTPCAVSGTLEPSACPQSTCHLRPRSEPLDRQHPHRAARLSAPMIGLRSVHLV
jgi:hypothetical protein